MPLTAYSRAYSRELDLAQWVSLHTQRPLQTGDLVAIEESWRTAARQDLACPSCGAMGVELVAAAGSRASNKIIRQACFRFRRTDSGNAHDPLCDFADEDERNSLPESLVNLTESKNKLMEKVRLLVCAGLQAGVFDHAKMRDMRLWFLAQKRESQFTVMLDPRIPQFLHAIDRQSFYGLNLAFHPTHAEIPGFDWHRAAQTRAAEPFRHLFEPGQLARHYRHEAVATRTSALAKRYHGKTLFDPSPLAVKYDQAELLTRFLVAAFPGLAKLKSLCFVSRSLEPQPPLLALAALLLFVSDWDTNQAIASFARLAAVGDVVDLTGGNIIGLNPFHDLRPLSLLRATQELHPPIDPEASIDALLTVAEAELREEHRQWKAVVLA